MSWGSGGHVRLLCIRLWELEKVSGDPGVDVG